MRHPIQPLALDASGVMRFKENAIVRYLLDEGGFDLNHIARKEFSQEDREQFAQLIGYSLSGFGELSYVSSDTYAAADEMAGTGVSEVEARITALEDTLAEVREGVRAAAAAAFRIHPDDLEA